MIQGIFYARFFPKEGPTIVSQSPAGLMGNPKTSTLDFDVLRAYIIPASPLVVRRLAVTFAEMEVQDGYLSGQEVEIDGGWGVVETKGRRTVSGLLEIVREDLNNYGECMIPVAAFRSQRLARPRRQDEALRHRRRHMGPDDAKIIAQIDGASDVRRIAFLADVSIDLAKTALRHLLYYDTILLLDMFFFSSCYAPRPGIADFVANVDGMVDECAAYACIHSRQRLSTFHLVRLMTSFCVGKSVIEWLKAHHDAGLDVLRYVDVRRFVQFGVIKGCLYRVHKYVVSKQYVAALASGQSASRPGGDPLQKYTDGNHCFDQIITELNLTDEEITEKLKSLPLPAGDLTVFYR
ncbi:unnamed protein product [Parascedosporium putredinis]|uniref:Nitrogen permease regulator 2 n=1 Tax=Parascedosporium putredinis TaxID=1442378 RepID=A0A9P1H8C4_9PEZI|nr:unnamed protein product [Parascedosporium putredinis]CAI8002242.1 unnamed protein product [Parascedosporium putredinis]